MKDSLLRLRHEMHRFPELSGKERQTARRIAGFLKPLKPDRLIEKLGGHGVMAVYDSGQPGPEVLFRADMDALPIAELLDLEYRSVSAGVSHKCGHDGHSAILAGLVAYIAGMRPQKGKVLLLFQPAEETGTGALAVLNDPLFAGFNPDYCFALHNLPGFEENTIVVRNGTFAAASCGMVIKLKGRVSHASEPEKGRSPAAVTAQLMGNLPRLAGNSTRNNYRDYILLTMIYTSMGAPAFGTTPGEAVLMATLRANLDSDMQALSSAAGAMVKEQAEKSGLDYEISFTEEFPATMNHPDAVKILTSAAASLNLNIAEAGLPFRWSEDFAHFALNRKAALFGIGAGLTHPSLHDPDYDFPDRLIPTGVSMWKAVYELLNR